MSNLFCLKHPSYKGEKSPDLSCKTCCSMFVAKIRNEQAAKKVTQEVASSDVYDSLANASSAATKTQKSNPSFDGSWI